MALRFPFLSMTGVMGLTGGCACDKVDGCVGGVTGGVAFGGVGSLALLIALATELAVESSERWRLERGTGVGMVPVSFSMNSERAFERGFLSLLTTIPLLLEDDDDELRCIVVEAIVV